MNSKSLKETTKRKVIVYTHLLWSYCWENRVKFTEALLENDYLKEKEECYKLTQNGKIG